MRIFFTVAKVFVLVVFVFAAHLWAGDSSDSGEPVVAGQEEPGGPIKSLDNGTVLGGRPAMPDQYRITELAAVRVEKVTGNLKIPWDMAFTRDGKRLFLTERPGRVRYIKLDGQTPVLRMWMDREASTLHWGEGGLMGIALHPDFGTGKTDPEGKPLDWIYLSETYGSKKNPANRILRIRKIQPQNGSRVEKEILIDRIPAASYHNGSRLAFGPDGMLYATTGDAGKPGLAQDKSSWAGKIIRITPEGEPAPGNPFPSTGPGAYIYSYGNRNPQGLAWHPETGDLYASEHGPSGEFGLGGNDEINRIKKGHNYGWPLAVGAPDIKNLQDPVALFDEPHLPPSGMDFYTGEKIGSWTGSLFVGSLRGEILLRAEMDNPESSQPITRIERIFEKQLYIGVYGRIRAVAAGPDGYLYFATSNRDGRGQPAHDDDRIMRIVPK